MSHPKFPYPGDSLTRTQRRRLQRQQKEVRDYYYGQREYRLRKRPEGKSSDEQETKSMSEDTAPSTAPDCKDRQRRQVDVSMVYVLPAQFGVKYKGQSVQEVDQGTQLPVEPAVNKGEEAVYPSLTEGIRVLREEGPSETVAITRPPSNMLTHVRPIYVKAILDGVPMNRILVDNGAAIKILPVATMKKLGKDSHDLVPTDVLVSSFVGDITTTRGILPLNVEVGRQKTLSVKILSSARC